MRDEEEHSNNRINWSSLYSGGALLLVIVGAFWALAFGPIQDKFSDFGRRVNSLEDNSIKFRDILDARRHEFVTQEEFKQFENLLNLITKRLDNLESTRPTTGELQATARGAETLGSKLEDRIRSLENYNRSKPIKE